MSKNPEKYLTITKQYGPQEFKEKGSRFISFLYPVGGKEEAEKILHVLRKKFHDATHVCFAYRLGEGEERYFRFSDDGEPSGTAGMPIYNEIKSSSYFNVLAAVVRYYGGTKLGSGGLARAYGKSAALVTAVSKKVTIYIKKEAEVLFPYHFTGEMMQVVKRYSLDIPVREDRVEGVYMKLAVPVGLIDEIIKVISNKSSGKVKLLKV
ncbi:MAG: YigZ family protein [Candidatus Aminicenantes bacterium]|nr:YigZ family protein [Candidatus Aminicenantes bacterium]